MKKIIYTLLLSLALFFNGCADAGKDQTVIANDLVTLDASNSTPDSSTAIDTYVWSQRTGPSVELSDDNDISPTFIAPDVEEETTILFRLITKETVSYSNEEYISIAFVLITVKPSDNTEEPERNIEPNAVITINLEDIPDFNDSINLFHGETISFSSEDSFDYDGQIVSYVWTDNNGTILSDAMNFTHTFETLGVQTITLTVTDDQNATNSNALSFEVSNDTRPQGIAILVNGVQSQESVTTTVNTPIDFSFAISEGTEIISQVWETSDMLSTEASFTHRFTENGTYILHLITHNDRDEEQVSQIEVIVEDLDTGER